ncbi:MAG: hypothetical protein HFJ57_01680 [Clostridia bacterium]|nr:hypothetical protein [Clostridia bacterium]
MKKWMVILFLIIVIIVAVFIGTSIFKLENNDNNPKQQQEENTNTENKIENVMKNDISIDINSEEEKISPNATLILKKTYKECGHSIKDYAAIPEELVNLTKEELEEQYKDWKVEKFTPLDITLTKEIEGKCNEHYILKLKDGVIAIYEEKEDESEVLKEMTGISTEYLTENDKMELEKGIKVYGKEELNSMIEDYE